MRLSGLWTFDTPYITKSGNYVTFAATDALFTLISREEVTQIDSLTAGFLLGESGSGRMQMTPGWRVKTNAGSFSSIRSKSPAFCCKNMHGRLEKVLQSTAGCGKMNTA